jgi:hypothetical protein
LRPQEAHNKLIEANYHKIIPINTTFKDKIVKNYHRSKPKIEKEKTIIKRNIM